MKVAAWNEYSTTAKGKLVIATEEQANTVTDALNIAEGYARRWNQTADEASRVNLLTCNGYVRAIL